MNANGTLPHLSLLDTGADFTVFPERVAAAAGIDISGAVASSQVTDFEMEGPGGHR